MTRYGPMFGPDITFLGVGRCDMYLICPEELRHSPRVRVVSDFVAEMLARHRPEMDPFAESTASHGV